MRTELSADEVSSYRNNGFLVVPELLDAAELEDWRETVERAMSERGEFHLPGLKFEYDAYKQMVFTIRINLWKTSERIRALMFDPRLGALAANLEGVDALRIHHDQALVKPPYGNPTGWHLDVPYWSCHTPHAISVWVALDDATLQNGCLMYLPGSHRAQRFEPVQVGTPPYQIAELFDIYPDWSSIEPVPCPVPAGGAVFHNGLTAHLAGPNLTPRPRRAMTCGYIPDGVTFNGIQNVLPDDYAKSLAVGDVLRDDSVNPVVFSRNGRQ
jgi:ectoine hydroxylase-related dioxygenase (phytanoyl-CoA dioxygenase family)